MAEKTNHKIIGSCYQNLVTGNQNRCVAYDGEILTLEGIGRIKVTFQISWRLVLSKYREIRKEERQDNSSPALDKP